MNEFYDNKLNPDYFEKISAEYSKILKQNNSNEMFFIKFNYLQSCIEKYICILHNFNLTNINKNTLKQLTNLLSIKKLKYIGNLNNYCNCLSITIKLCCDIVTLINDFTITTQIDNFKFYSKTQNQYLQAIKLLCSMYGTCKYRK